MRRWLLLLLTLPLAAQTPSDLGVRVHGLAPMGDLRNLTGDRLGFGVAGYVDLHFEELSDLVFRPLLEADYVPPGDQLGLSGNQKTKAFATFFGGEVLWRTSGQTEGPYLAMALGAQSWRITEDQNGTTTRIQGTKLGVNGGVGYQFTKHLAFEARTFWSPVDQGFRATGLTAGMAWTF
jgi:hypothetical protein